MNPNIIIPPHRNAKVRAGSKMFAEALGFLWNSGVSKVVNLPHGEFMIVPPLDRVHAPKAEPWRMVMEMAWINDGGYLPIRDRPAHQGHIYSLDGKNPPRAVFSSLDPENSVAGNITVTPGAHIDLYDHPGFLISTVGLDQTPTTSLPRALSNMVQGVSTPSEVEDNLARWAIAEGSSQLTPQSLDGFVRSGLLPSDHGPYASRAYPSFVRGAAHRVPNHQSLPDIYKTVGSGVVGAYLPDGQQAYNAYRFGRQIVQHPDEIIPRTSTYNVMPRDFENPDEGLMVWHGREEPTWVVSHIYPMGATPLREAPAIGSARRR